MTRVLCLAITNGLCCHKVWLYDFVGFSFRLCASWRLVFSLFFPLCSHTCVSMLLYSSFPLLICVVKTMGPLCWKNAKWSIVHLYTSIECDFWTLLFVFHSFSICSAVLCCRCYCHCRCHCCRLLLLWFCVSARDIFLYARDSATTFEECINIHIICVCQWTKVLVIIRPLIMTHWLSHTPHNTQRRQRQRKIHFFLAHILQHLFVIRFQRK